MNTDCEEFCSRKPPNPSRPTTPAVGPSLRASGQYFSCLASKPSPSGQRLGTGYLTFQSSVLLHQIARINILYKPAGRGFIVRMHTGSPALSWPLKEKRRQQASECRGISRPQRNRMTVLLAVKCHTAPCCCTMESQTLYNPIPHCQPRQITPGYPGNM